MEKKRPPTGLYKMEILTDFTYQNATWRLIARYKNYNDAARDRDNCFTPALVFRSRKKYHVIRKLQPMSFNFSKVAFRGRFEVIGEDGDGDIISRWSPYETDDDDD